DRARPCMRASVCLLGPHFAPLVAGGALLTEVVFGIHGVGSLTWQALTNLDLPTLMATTIYGAFFIVLINAIVDIAYAWLDPRIRPTRCSRCGTSRSRSDRGRGSQRG